MTCKIGYPNYDDVNKILIYIGQIFCIQPSHLQDLGLEGEMFNHILLA